MRSDLQARQELRRQQRRIDAILSTRQDLLHTLLRYTPNPIRKQRIRAIFARSDEQLRRNQQRLLSRIKQIHPC